jgi:hypothetical protein
MTFGATSIVYSDSIATLQEGSTKEENENKEAKTKARNEPRTEMESEKRS